MKINYIDNDIFDVYIIKDKIKNIDFNSDKDIKKILKILEEKYSINIEGFYDICIYVDKYYGVVIHLEKDKDYYSYYKEIDFRITI